MYVTVGSNLVNLYFNVALIYGSDKIIEYFTGSKVWFLKYLWIWYDYPELQVEGAGIATLIASISLVIFYMIPLFSREMIHKYHSIKLKINLVILKTQIRLATPLFFTEIAHQPLHSLPPWP